MGAKRFLKGLSWLLVLNLLIKPAWIFVIDRQVQNRVGHEEYGTYFALFNLCYVASFVADAGLTGMLTQRLAANENLPLRQLLSLKIVLLFLYAAVCVLVAMLTGISQWPVLLYLVVIQGLNSLLLFLRGLLAARQFFTTDAFFSVLDKLLLFLLCIGPVYGWFMPITLQLFLQLQVISVFVTAGSLAVFLVRKKQFATGETLAVKKLLSQASPFVLLILLMSAHNRLDAFLLERRHPEGALQAGIYAMAYRLLEAANMVGYLTASFLVPFLSRNRSDHPLLEKVVLFSRHGLLFLAAVAVAFAAVFSPWIQAMLYHTTDTYSNRVLVLCLACLPAYYLVHVYGSVLTALSFFREFIAIVLVFVLINIALNVWLIPAYGAMGCCVAALFSQYGCGITLWLSASRKLAISFATKTAFLYPAAAIIFGLLFYLAKTLTGNVWIILTSIALPGFVLLLAGRNTLKKIFLLVYK